MRCSHVDAAKFVNNDGTPNMTAVTKALGFIADSFVDVPQCECCHTMLNDIRRVLEGYW
jgi:hypothetical protein